MFICSICVHLYSFVHIFRTRVFICMWMCTRIATGVVIWWTSIMSVCMMRARTIAKQEKRWLAYFDETINIFVRFFVCNSQTCRAFVCRSFITQITPFFCTTIHIFVHDNQYLGTMIHISVRWLGYADKNVHVDKTVNIYASYVWHDGFICVTWLIRKWDTYRWHDNVDKTVNLDVCFVGQSTTIYIWVRQSTFLYAGLLMLARPSTFSFVTNTHS